MKNEIQSQQSNLDYCNETVVMHEKITGAYLMLAERLYNIREQELYKPQYETFWEFCQEMRDMSNARVSRLIGIYSKYIVEYQFEPERVEKVGWTILARTLPVVKTREDAEEFLDSGWSRSDMEKAVKEKETGIDMTTCEHIDHFDVRICRTCGFKHEIYVPEE